MSEPNSRIVTIAGGSGVVGQHLIAAAREDGWSVRVLTRDASSRRGDVAAFQWDPATAASGNKSAAKAIAGALEGAALIVNLAGAPITDGRLGKRHLHRVVKSRVDAVEALASGLAACEPRPSCWIQASAVGFYGDTGEAAVTESNPPGRGLLADVCLTWEAAARRGARVVPDIRLIVARIGLVLAEDAPAWRKMIRPIRLGVGGRLGSGQQWLPWIDASDLARALLYLHDRPSSSGVYNVAAPEPARQIDLAKGAAHLLGRPAIFPVPAFALRALLGRVADEAVLASNRVLPERLLEAGFVFERPDIDSELAFLLEGS